MKTVTLFTVAPAGGAEEDYKQMEQFVSELNRFYEKFNLHVELTAYGMSLPVRKGGQYSVKALQSRLMGLVKQSVLCCMVFFCKKEELAPDEMNTLLRNLMQQRKAEVVAYFKPNEDMQPVRNDIMRRMIQLDEKTVFSKGDQKRLSDMAKNFLNYGCICDRENKIKEAEAAYKESLVIQRKLVKADAETYLPDLSLPYHNLGTLYYRTNRLKEAENMYREAIKTRQLLVEKKGDQYLSFLVVSKINMGALYMRTNRLEEAEKIYQEILEIRKKLASSLERDDRLKRLFADVYGNLGNLYNKQNRLDDAEASFKAALEIEESLLEKYNEEAAKAEEEAEAAGAANTELKSDAGSGSGGDSDLAREPEKKQVLQANEKLGMELKKKIAMASNTLGVIYLKQKRLEEAEDRYLAAYKFYTELAQGKPEEFEPPLAMACYNLGNIYRSMKQVKEAGDYLDKAYSICSRRKDSSTMCKQLYDAMNEAKKEAMKKSAEIVRLLEQKGKDEREKGNFEDAIKCYQQAAGVYREMEAAEYQAKAALLYNELGLLYWDINQLEQAEESYQTSLEIYRKLAEEDSSHLSDVAIACYNLGLFYQEIRDEEVNDYLREAFETAGKCLEDNEQCREIYENLENEPLYGNKDDSSLSEQTLGDASEQEDPDTARSVFSGQGGAGDLDKAGNGKDKENEGSPSSSGSWWKKLWGKK